MKKLTENFNIAYLKKELQNKNDDIFNDPNSMYYH